MGFDEELNAAFDEFVAAGLAPWLVARIGNGLHGSAAASQGSVGFALLPDSDNVLDVPRLDGSLIPNILVGGKGDWFLPDLSLFAEPDPAFGFAVTQTDEVAEGGGPFNRGTLTFSLRAVKPPNLADDPGSQNLRQVPDLDLGLTLNVPIRAPDGSTNIRSVPGTVTPDGGPFTSFTETGVVTFNLTGPMVEAVYMHLTRGGEATLEIAASYTGYQTTLVTPPEMMHPNHGPLFHNFEFEPFGDGTPGALFEPLSDFYWFFPVTTRFTRTAPVGLAFGTDAYRSRFTITTGRMTRPIIDVNDLHDFASPRSEYRELTSLGDVTERYPSLRRLYFGQISGTVVAVPVAYGIVRTAQGLLAACDSIVDDSPSAVTGCRFHFTFTISPMADPTDLARLRADITGIPEAAGRTLRVALPAGLDPRNPPSLDGFPAAKAAFSDGQAPAVQVGVEIADGQAALATTNVNLFLQQLASTGPAPLFGNIAVRLDDVFPQPVRTQAVLNLRQTADGDDLKISGDPPAFQAVNQGPLDLMLHRSGAVQERQVTVASLGDQVLPAGKSTALAGAGQAASIVVSRGLAVPAPLPKAAMLQFVAFHTHIVQEVRHPLTVNAAGLNFTAGGISLIEIQIAMTANPGVAIPAMTLSPSHTIDSVDVSIPVDSAVTGLDCAVALTVTTTAGQRTAEVSHDFIDEPILVVTQSTMT